MNKNEWIEVVKGACMDAKTYKPYFDTVIDTLAQILEIRDQIHNQYVEEGCQPIIFKTTDRSKAQNANKNPLLSLENEYNTLALKYFAELGLTSKSLKAIQNSLKAEDSSSLSEVLANLENG